MLRSLAFLLSLSATHASSSAICDVMNPALDALDSIEGLECSCVADASHVGGTASCSVTTPDESFNLGTFNFDVPRMTLRIETDVQPCGNPATVALQADLTLYDVDPALNNLIQTAVNAIDQAPSPNRVSWNAIAKQLTIREQVEAGGDPATVDIPIKHMAIAQLTMQLSLSVEGNIDSLTVNSGFDLCVKDAAGGIAWSFCGADIPTCNPPIPLQECINRQVECTFCTLVQNNNIPEFLGNPPWDLFPAQTYSFGSACAAPAPGALPPTSVRMVFRVNGEDLTDPAIVTEIKAMFADAITGIQPMHVTVERVLKPAAGRRLQTGPATTFTVTVTPPPGTVQIADVQDEMTAEFGGGNMLTQLISNGILPAGAGGTVSVTVTDEPAPYTPSLLPISNDGGLDGGAIFGIVFGSLV